MLENFYKNHSLVGTTLRIIKFVTTFMIAATIFLTGAVVFLYFYFAYDLPNIQTLKDHKPPVVSEVFDVNGKKMGEFWSECRFWLPIESMPKQVVNAFIAAEDARFFEHRGVDMLGIGRAMLENLKAGHIVQGGSTITQQITRSILLTSERKIARKVREAILATRIERNLNKEQILELYLNQIFLGNRAYGIKAAARNYFHKNVSELSLAEMAMIAGMPTAPSVDSPVHSIEKAKERQEVVLNKMRDNGFINREQVKTALLEPLTVHVAGIDKDFNYDAGAPYFTEEVRRKLIEKYGDKTLYGGGLKIYTTGNLEWNIAAQKALRDGLEALDKRQGYRGPIDTTDDPEKYAESVHNDILREIRKKIIHIPTQPETYETTPLENDKFYKAVVNGFDGNSIKVLVGRIAGSIPHSGFKWARSFNTESAGYDDANYLSDPRNKFKRGDVVLVKKSAKEFEFNLAQKPLVQGAVYSIDPNNGYVKAIVGGWDFADSEFNRATQALRQPGSSFKPFIYAAALDKGFKFSTPIMDSPASYYVGVGQPVWAPKNYDGKYSGLTTFESDLIHSRNVPTVKIAHDIGLHYLTAYVRKMGLETQIWKYLSMALGSNSVYLDQMVKAYATFASGGIRPTPVMILKVVDNAGEVLEEYIEKTPTENDSSSIVPENVAVDEETAAKMKGLNTELFNEARNYIERDKLVLSQEDMKVLYGDVIPKDHTITPQTAFLMQKMLSAAVERGTGTRVKALGKPVAGKTGTTNDETDCWFIGFVPDLVAGVWIGFDNIAKIGAKETGGKTAAPIFLSYMKEATKDFEAKKFAPPEGVKEDRIANLSGGSAIYYRSFSMLRESARGERQISDRAIDFFEDDLGGNASPAPAMPQTGNEKPAAEPADYGSDDGF